MPTRFTDSGVQNGSATVNKNPYQATVTMRETGEWLLAVSYKRAIENVRKRL